MHIHVDDVFDLVFPAFALSSVNKESTHLLNGVDIHIGETKHDGIKKNPDFILKFSPPTNNEEENCILFLELQSDLENLTTKKAESLKRYLQEQGKNVNCLTSVHQDINDIRTVLRETTNTVIVVVSESLLSLFCAGNDHFRGNEYIRSGLSSSTKCDKGVSEHTLHLVSVERCKITGNELLNKFVHCDEITSCFRSIHSYNLHGGTLYAAESRASLNQLLKRLSLEQLDSV